MAPSGVTLFLTHPKSRLGMSFLLGMVCVLFFILFCYYGFKLYPTDKEAEESKKKSWVFAALSAVFFVLTVGFRIWSEKYKNN